MGSLFHELKRRKVIRVAAAYAVVAWLLMQVADVVLPTFGAPEWVNQTIIFVFVIGFPIALVLAWAFEISADGVKWESKRPEADIEAVAQDQSLNQNFDISQKSSDQISIGPQVFLFSAFSLIVGAISMYAFLGTWPESSSQSSISIPFSLQNWTLPSVYPTPTFEVSPDGSMVVYIDGEINMLRLQYTDSLEHRLLEGTAGATNPFFSPDSQWIGFFLDGILQRMPVLGGRPSFITSIGQQNPLGATWLEDDRIVWGTIRSGLYSASLDSGVVEPLTNLDTDNRHTFPSTIKERSAILFTKSIGRAQIWLLDLVTGEQRYLFDGDKANYVDSGHIIYANGPGYLWSVSFDIGSLELVGEPSLIREDVSLGGLAYSVADNDILLYFRLPDDSETSLMLHTPGQQSRVLDRGNFGAPSFSNDGQSIVVTTFSPSGPSIFRYDIESATSSQIAANAFVTLWSPDDRSVTFLRPGVGLVRKELETEGSPEQVVIEHDAEIYPNAWIAGGDTLVYNAIFPETSTDLFALHKDGQLDVLEQDESETWATKFTSDDEWVTYIFNNSVYVSRYPDFSIRWLVADGLHPKWQNDESILFTSGPDVMAVDVTFSPTIAFGEPYKVVEIGQSSTFIPRFDVDGQGRVVYINSDYTEMSPALVLNLSADLD